MIPTTNTARLRKPGCNLSSWGGPERGGFGCPRRIGYRHLLHPVNGFLSGVGCFLWLVLLLAMDQLRLREQKRNKHRIARFTTFQKATFELGTSFAPKQIKRKRCLWISFLTRRLLCSLGGSTVILINLTCTFRGKIDSLYCNKMYILAFTKKTR